MLAITLKEEHSRGTTLMEIWRSEHGDIRLSVCDSEDCAQFDFTLTKQEVEDIIYLLERANSRDGNQPKEVAEIN